VTQRMFTFASAISLILCVATVSMWVRSHSRWEWIGYQVASGRFYSVMSRLGAVTLDVTDGWPRGTYPELIRRSDPLRVQTLPAPTVGSFLGCGLDRTNLNIGVAATGWTGILVSRSVIVPYWLLCAVFVIAPLRMAILVFRPRPLPGMCRRCGYDLRASPDRCPECGTPVPSKGRVMT